MQNPLISCLDFSLFTPKKARVLFSGLSIDVLPGKIVTLIGANGVGKSSLLKCFYGDCSYPFTGKMFKGVENGQIGYLPQISDFDYPIPLRLGDILSFFQPDFSATEAGKLTSGLLTTSDLMRPWAAASGGERQKTLLSGLFLQGRPLLLLDEPSNHLDVDSLKSLSECLESYTAKSGGSVVLVTHEGSLPGEKVCLKG